MVSWHSRTGTLRQLEHRRIGFQKWVDPCRLLRDEGIPWNALSLFERPFEESRFVEKAYSLDTIFLEPSLRLRWLAV